MNNSLGIISAFLGGALVGTAAALLFAPEKGEDLREIGRASCRERVSWFV